MLPTTIISAFSPLKVPTYPLPMQPHHKSTPHNVVRGPDPPKSPPPSASPKIHWTRPSTPLFLHPTPRAAGPQQLLLPLHRLVPLVEASQPVTSTFHASPSPSRILLLFCFSIRTSFALLHALCFALLSRFCSTFKVASCSFNLSSHTTLPYLTDTLF
ncbi:hypothetical protein CMEL01_04187 [Colletotrichum melonis]|uniref:Uncharacterized protein n=1 Tax=Colletotrichum melonis TaxID=1209925 RepID=A0AAI9UBQ6_9PEZI|nr:hypothetical protein CMEL01_04187 [Colletotrichum melonis]